MGRKHDNIRRTIYFHDYFSRLKMLAITRFEYEGLPETCNARFLEETLFDYGIACIVDDPEKYFINTKVTPSGILNHYNEPLSYTCYSTGYNRIFEKDECFIIRNNPLEKSTESTLVIFAEELARLRMIKNINLNAQKTPLLIRADEKTKVSLDIVLNNYEGDKPVIVVTKAMQDKPLEVLKTDAPFLADKIRDEMRAVWNEALEFLGINTNPSDKKKERLIVNEVDANNEQTDAQGNIFLSSRREGLENFNKKTKFNVTVKIREITPEELREITGGEWEEGEEDE